MTIYMITMPRNSANKRILKLFIEKNDVHKWVVGYETGRTGYKHFQCRIQTGVDFEQLKLWFDDAHIEQASDDWSYERKEGRFVSSDDTIDIRRCRFGKLRDNQQRILDILEKTNDREIVIWYDRTGNVGKSFLTRWLVERGRAYYVPPTLDNAKQIIQWVCSGYQNQPYIVIDIPRSAKWTQSLYTGIEAIKDGIIYDTRYSSKLRDIWGVKILVLTNSEPKLDALSKDRWVIIDENKTMSIR